ncbi:MAG: type II toxin-antitoxin system VapC family toxin [Anaerolineales bacterium]
MNFLLDTHTFLWFIGGQTKLSRKVKELIEEPENQPYISIASLWEMAIKTSLGKVSLDQPLETLIPEQMSVNGIALMGLSFDHVVQVGKLPFHHGDPFDRMLIAQAMVEKMPIASVDGAFDDYGIKRLW